MKLPSSAVQLQQKLRFDGLLWRQFASLGSVYAPEWWLGEKARRHPDVVREIHAGGHTLGVHGDCPDRLHSSRRPIQCTAGAPSTTSRR